MRSSSSYHSPPKTEENVVSVAIVALRGKINTELGIHFATAGDHQLTEIHGHTIDPITER